MVKGKAALVTGGSRGIGFGIARSLLAAGAKVCITGRKQESLDAAIADLGAGENLIAVGGKSHDPRHRQDAVEQVIDRLGGLDLLVNNAATNVQYGDLMDADLQAVEKIMEINVVAPLGWVQEVWRNWMAEHGGVILNVASTGGIRPGLNIGSYNTSKAALIQLTKQLALELSPDVRVNAIAPATVKTAFARHRFEGREEKAAAAFPLKRLGTVDDTAALARFLLSSDASWITGETVVIDGGTTLTRAER